MRARRDYKHAYHRFLHRDTVEQYRIFSVLATYLENPPSLVTSTTIPLPHSTQRHLIARCVCVCVCACVCVCVYESLCVPVFVCESLISLLSYYHIDDEFAKEVVGRQLSRGLRKDLDEVAEKTKLSIISCRRQVCVRVLRVLVRRVSLTSLHTLQV